VPRRLTPGYELRLKGPQMAAIYAAIALSLPIRELVGDRRQTPGARRQERRRP
jgi:hypothetical protein